MKRILASALALATILGCSVFSASAEAPSKQTNVEVEALAFENAPSIDGVISVEEWGESTVVVDSATANTDESADFSPYNTYFYNHTGNESANNLKYTLWLRWDAKNFYLGAVIDDPDGYNLPAGRANIWDGDCLQFRIDPIGVNSSMLADNSDYDYRTTGFDVDKYTRPWVVPNEICSIGVGDTGKTKTPKQAVDMANGNIVMNDGKSLSANLAAELGIDKASEDNGSKTTIELRIPLAYLSQTVAGYDDMFKLDAEGNTTAFYIGKVLGMSAVVLDSTAGSAGFDSYLEWGSGICGHQHDKKQNPGFLVDNGGANAVILSDRNALDTSKKVEGLPDSSSVTPTPVEHVDQVIYSAMDDGANYFGIGSNYTFGDDGFTVSFDACILDTNVQDESRSLEGIYFGNDYSLVACYDYVSQSFMLARHNWVNGVNRDTIFKQSPKFQWLKSDKDNNVAGTWHNLAFRLKGDTMSIYCDGILVLEDTDVRYSHRGTFSDNNPKEFTPFTEEEIAQMVEEGKQSGDEFNFCREIIVYNSCEALMDNFVLADSNYDVIKNEGNVTVSYTFDNDDEVYRKSQTRRLNGSLSPQIDIICNSRENNEEYLAGHNFRYQSSTKDEVCFKCAYCTETKVIKNDGSYPADAPAAVPGDINGDGSVNAKDVSALLKKLALLDVPSFVEANADYNGDGNINAKDVSKLLKELAAK